MDKSRRAPAVEKRIPEVTETDIKIRVIGRVIKPDDSGFTLEYDKNSIKVDTQENHKEGTLVRVFGRPTNMNNELVLSSELIQDINSMDEKVYKKIKTQGL